MAIVDEGGGRRSKPTGHVQPHGGAHSRSAVDLLIVGADDGDLRVLEAELPELRDLQVIEVPIDGDPASYTTPAPRAIVLFQSGANGRSEQAWLDASAPAPALLVGAEGATPAPEGVEAVPATARDRLVPSVARLLQRAARRGDGGAPSISYSERLLRTTSPLPLCQVIADEIAVTTGAAWSAVLCVTGEARAFELAGSVGAVPSLLQSCHNMTPVEMAGALGWSSGFPTAQFAERGSSTLASGLTRNHGRAAFAVLAGRSTLEGVALVGWAPGAILPLDILATLETLCDAGAASLRYAKLITDLRISERTKSEFVATMSHELRNPLSAILGYLELLLHGDFGTIGEEQAEVLRRAHQSANSLLDLINATLDVSRFEVGDRADQKVEVDLLGVLQEQIVEISRARRSDSVCIEVLGGGRLVLLSDPLKVRVAIRQLLEASLSTNPGGTLLAVAKCEEAGCAIEIAPKGMQNSRRDSPVLVELPADGETQGVSFAVFVAKRLLEILGGTLAVWRDEENDRVAFRMWIPNDQA